MATAAPPIDLQRLAQEGVASLQRGDAAAARGAFQRIADAGRATPQLWLLLAQACERLGDDAAENEAIDKVLTGDPGNPYPMLLKADLLVRVGNERAAVTWYERALAAGEAVVQKPSNLVQRLDRARQALAASQARFRRHLDDALAAAGVGADTRPARFEEALAIQAGTAAPMLQQPTSFYYPGLPQTAFYERDAFAWVPAVEALVPRMRAEAEAALARGEGLAPYVERPDARPSKEHALLDDARWSAFHLLKDGEPVAANAARCPATMEALAHAPLPRIRGRAPMALFSVLDAATHIPPHNGMLNTRLIVHIPLIVPDGCRLRVGNHVRPVEAGKAMIFDDSIEHEAWNDGVAPRTVLLFEIWRPELAEGERAALTALFDSVSSYAPPAGTG